MRGENSVCSQVIAAAFPIMGIKLVNDVLYQIMYELIPYQGPRSLQDACWGAYPASKPVWGVGEPTSPKTYLKKERLPRSCCERGAAADPVLVHPRVIVGRNPEIGWVAVQHGEVQVGDSQVAREVLSCSPRASQEFGLNRRQVFVAFSQVWCHCSRAQGSGLRVKTGSLV